MEILELQDKMVAIAGFGQKEGKATAEYLIKHGISPVLFDQRPWEAWSEADQEYIRGLKINYIFGPESFAELKGFDVIFRNPAVWRLHPAILAEEKRGAVITSQTKWFFDHCPGKIIGVTGTKGKGTTSTLISEILKLEFQMKNFSAPNKIRRGGSAFGGKFQTYITGNIGQVQPFEILDTIRPDDWVVYELSSFQLQDLHKSPHIGVVLMVTSEHLDHHENIREYREAKSSIVKYQTESDFAIINADFEASKNIGHLGKGKKLFFSRKHSLPEGCYVKDDKIVVNFSAEGGSAFGGNFQISKLQLRGAHNLENVCAAILASSCAGAKTEAITKSLEKFAGLEHRLEFIAKKNGVLYYNDSFSTTPETAIAAIEAFSEPEIVILGGSTKHSDFENLGRIIADAKNLKALILIGEESGRIKKAVADAGGFGGKILEGSSSMIEIFDQIRSVAENGDIVLLSPACASFGMFENYKDRGGQFKKQVMQIMDINGN